MSTTASSMFKKASRKQVFLKIGVDGPSGSGKTKGALTIATELAKHTGSRIAVIDSENGSASLYADSFDFDTCDIAAPHEITKLLGAVNAAVDAGYKVIVVDSISHYWENLLERKEAYDRMNPRSNSFTNWKLFSAEWTRAMAALLAVKAHVVGTMRSKQAYELGEKDGRKSVTKVGLAPVVRDGTEYEFSLVFSLNSAHGAEATKDRTGLFGGRMLDLCNDGLSEELIAWMEKGEEAPIVTELSLPTSDTLARIEGLLSEYEALSPDAGAKARAHFVELAVATEAAADEAAKFFTQRLDKAKEKAKALPQAA